MTVYNHIYSSINTTLATFEALCLTFPSTHYSHGPSIHPSFLSSYRPVSTPITSQFIEEFSSDLESIVTRDIQLFSFPAISFWKAGGEKRRNKLTKGSRVDTAYQRREGGGERCRAVGREMRRRGRCGA